VLKKAAKAHENQHQTKPDETHKRNKVPEQKESEKLRDHRIIAKPPSNNYSTREERRTDWKLEGAT
jgi:hypothetical protein